MYNSIESSYNYSKTAGSFWQCYKDESNANLADSESFKSKIKTIRRTLTDGNIRDVKIAVRLKYLSNFLENNSNAFN